MPTNLSIVSDCFEPVDEDRYLKLHILDSSTCETHAESVKTLVETLNSDTFEAFVESLEQLRIDLRRSGKWIKSWKVGQVLQSDTALSSVYQQTVRTAAASYVVTNANGDFAKWFLEWLQNGGWAFILKIIMDLISIGG